MINYIESRGIDIGIAKKFCRQIEYTVGNAHYSSIGFENIIGGWEIRDKSFKGATVKAISVINHSSSSVCVFEGFFDLLSFVQLNIDSFVNYDLLSLNSLSLIKKSVTLLERYQNIILFLDNDERGREVAYSLSQSFGAKVDDRSNMYSSFKDLNEYLTTKKGKGGGYSEIVAM
ncbi:MAG: toprim domain-containing protein [Bacteroidota bacterium]